MKYSPVKFSWFISGKNSVFNSVKYTISKSLKRYKKKTLTDLVFQEM